VIRPLPPSLPRRCRSGLLGLLFVLLGTGGPAAAEPTAWEALTPEQRQALGPLQRDWPSLDASRRSKWLEVATRFPRMSADEQRRLQERMTQWTRLTPAERERARLQFQETRQLPADEKRARWEAYQALSEEERQALAQRAEKPAKGGSRTDNGTRRATTGSGTAKNNLVELRPAPPARSVAPSVVTARPGATTTTVTTPAAPPLHHQPGLPKIAATPGFVDPATLLPRRGPQGAAVSAPASAAAGSR
jgi:hypothetical protein